MRIIALSTLKTFWEENPAYADVTEPVLAWYRHVLKADWASPAEVKEDFRSASILKDGRVVFNIAGNKYRLVVWINSSSDRSATRITLKVSIWSVSIWSCPESYGSESIVKHLWISLDEKSKDFSGQNNC